MVGCVLKEDHPASSMCKAPRALGHLSLKSTGWWWWGVQSDSVCFCQALADMVDFRA